MQKLWLFRNYILERRNCIIGKMRLAFPDSDGGGVKALKYKKLSNSVCTNVTQLKTQMFQTGEKNSICIPTIPLQYCE